MKETGVNSQLPGQIRCAVISSSSTTAMPAGPGFATTRGKLVWSLKLPVAYPSDPQQLGPDLYLVADHKPGGIYEFNRAGKILWSYHPSSGLECSTTRASLSDCRTA